MGTIPGQSEVTTTNLNREVEQHLGEHQVRYTRGRRVVVEVLAGGDGPMSAAEINRELRGSIPLSSLYRTLSVLEKAGVLVPHHGHRTVTRYELAEWLRGHHHHLVCLGCGSVEDIELPDELETEVTQLVAGIGSITHFMPVNHALEIEGRCARCA